MVGAEKLYKFPDFPCYISKLYVHQLFPNQIKIYTSVELNVLENCLRDDFKPWQDPNSHDTPILNSKYEKK